MLKLALKYQIECVQESLATYRIHNKGFSINNKLMEVYEQRHWYKKFLKSHNINNSQKLKFYKFKKKIDLKKKILLDKNLREKIFLFFTLLINFDISNFKVLLNPFSVKN